MEAMIEISSSSLILMGFIHDLKEFINKYQIFYEKSFAILERDHLSLTYYLIKYLFD